MKTKPIILCLISGFPPGFRDGGPTKSIINFVNLLGEDFEILIVCRDRESGDKKSYPQVKVDEWNLVGKARVFYASKKTRNLFGISKLIKKTNYDILYLNSFFSYNFTILPLLARFLKLVNIKPCVVAPRGEFSKNAINIKKFKKKFFIWLVQFFKLYHNVYWQASSDYEVIDIIREFKAPKNMIEVAPDLISPLSIIVNKIQKRKPGLFRIIFLSRITPMKNLVFLINVLSKVSQPLAFGIFGIKEDKNYWNICKKLLKKLPLNIKVNIGDELTPNKVSIILKKFDLLVLPTLGENFGHIVPESLFVGTPVLISDQTSWTQDKLLGVKTLPLKENLWVKNIEEYANLPEKLLIKRRKAALKYANKVKTLNNKFLIKNKLFFQNII